MKPYKKCKLCDDKRYANLSLCFSHYRTKQRVRRDEKISRKLSRRLKSKTYQESDRKKWHKKTWKIVSEIVRRKDADFAGNVACYTCGKSYHWKEMNAGHWKHGVLDFDMRNLKVQCTRCNLRLSGRLDVYTLNLIKDYGIEWVRTLSNDASKHIGYTAEEVRVHYVLFKGILDNLT